jgi:uncharacterized phage protein (TIGR02220 family)
MSSEEKVLLEELGQAHFNLLGGVLKKKICKAMREYSKIAVLDDFEEEVKEIIHYFNDWTSSRCKVSKNSIKPIQARLRQGLTVDEAKAIIVLKTVNWANDPKMAPYLRISTLFGEQKCNEYLNELNRMKANKFALAEFRKEAIKHGKLTPQNTVGNLTSKAFSQG